jgi:hypothetical protein
MEISAPLSTPPAARHRGRARAASIVLVLLLCLAATCLAAGWLRPWGDNFWAVVPGRVYRSARMNPEELDRVIQEKRLRTVLSLEGGNARRPWWRQEDEVCRRRGVEHRTLYMQGFALPQPEALQQVLAVFDTAEYPLLFHCRQGADRSGLVAALYLHLYAGRPLDEAQRSELTWRKGHLGFGPATFAEQFLNLYRRTGQGLSLRDWILTRYPDVYARAVR